MKYSLGILFILFTCFTLSLQLQAAFAEDPFSNYLTNGSGNHRCFPPYRRPHCGASKTELQEAEKEVYLILDECGKALDDKTVIQKFAMAASAATAMLSPAAAKFAASVWGDAPYDFLECMAKGMTRASLHHPERQEEFTKLISLLARARDIKGDVQGSVDWTKFKQGSTPYLAKAFEAYEMGLHKQDITGASSLIDGVSSLFPGTQAQAYLEDARAQLKSCNFKLARQVLADVLGPLHRECTWAGYHYRAYERYVQCYHDWHENHIVKWGSEYHIKRYNDMLRSLRANKISSLRSLSMFDEYDELQKAVDIEEIMILGQQKKLIHMSEQAMAAIRAGQLKEACEISFKIDYVIRHSSNRYVNCPEMLDNDIDDIKSEIHDQLSRMIEFLKQRTSDASKAIASCNLTEAEKLLGTAAALLPKLYAPSNNQCRPALESFELDSKIKAVWQDLKGAKTSCAKSKTPSRDANTIPEQRIENKAPDCSHLQEQYKKRWQNLDQTASKLACAKKSFSGCATKFAGCRTRLLPRHVFSDKRCQIPGYLSCATGAYENYISCVMACNSAWRNTRQELGPCGTKCQGAAESVINTCKGQ